MISISPDRDAVPLYSFDTISRVAPPIPKNSPLIFATVTLYLNNQKARIVMSKGDDNMSREAWIVEVIVNPLIKSIWLIATPINPQRKNLPRCSLRMPGLTIFFPGNDFPLNQSPQNNKRLTPTLMILSP